MRRRHRSAAGTGVCSRPERAAQDPPLREAYPGDDFTVREAMVPMRDGVKLYTLILTPEAGVRSAADPAGAHPYDATRALGGRPTTAARGLAGDGLRRRRLHLRGAGPAGPLQVGGRLRDVPRAARRLQPHGHGRDHRRLGHDRLARQERDAEQRQGGHVGHLLPGLAHARGAAGSASRARRGRALQSGGRRVEGRRLVPLGRVPARLRLRLHLLDGDAQGRRPRRIPTRRATCTAGCSSRAPPRTSAGASTTATRCGSG